MGSIILFLLVALPVGDTVATAFFFSLFLRSKRPTTQAAAEVLRRPRLWGGPVLLGGRSWLLGLMTLAWATITIVFILIGYLAGRRLLGQPPLPQGAALTAIGLIVLGLIPIAFAVAFYATRKRRGGPPPFRETD